MSKKSYDKYGLLLDRVLIKPIEETMSKGGLHLVHFDTPKGAKRGKVMAAGPGKHTPRGVLIPNTLKGGEVVLYGDHCGIPLDFTDEKLLMMNEADVIAIVVE
jgi:chaperonin GroES